MEKMDTSNDVESPHHVDYELLMDHVVQDDHELLYMDTYLRELLGNDTVTGESESETI